MRLVALVSFALFLSALSRAEQADAYKSLRGMAESAATDRGPNAGGIDGAKAERAADPKRRKGFSSRENGAARAGGTASAETDLRDSVSDTRPAAAAPREEEAKPEGPSVAAPFSPRPRLWTRLFAALLPPSKPRFDAPQLSTATRRLTPEEAAGQARGLQEIISVGSPAPLSTNAR